MTSDKALLVFSETSILIDEEDCSVGNLRRVEFSIEEKTPVMAVSSSNSGLSSESQ